MHHPRLNLIFIMTITMAMFAVTSNSAAPAAIAITNYTPDEEIRYAVPLIRGTLDDPQSTEISAINTSSTRDTREMKGLAYKGQFKVMTELLPGENKLLLRSGKN
jgi:hypothetical protein